MISSVKRKNLLASDIPAAQLSMWNEKGNMTIRASAYEASILRMRKGLKGNHDKYGLTVYGRGGWPLPFL